MKNKKIIRTIFMLLLVAGFLFAYPTVAHAASATGGEIENGITGFFGAILHYLTMICNGIIGLFAALAQLIWDFIMLIVGLFT